MNTPTTTDSDNQDLCMDLPQNAKTGIPNYTLFGFDLVVIRAKNGAVVPSKFEGYDVRHAEHYRGSTKMEWNAQSGTLKCQQCGRSITVSSSTMVRIARVYANGTEIHPSEPNVYLVLVD